MVCFKSYKPISLFIYLLVSVAVISSCNKTENSLPVVSKPIGFKLMQHPESFVTEGVSFEDVIDERTINMDTRKVFKIGRGSELAFEINAKVGWKVRFSYGVSGEAFRFGREIKIEGNIIQGETAAAIGEAIIKTRGSQAKEGWSDAEWEIPGNISGLCRLVFSLDGVDEGAPDDVFLLAHPAIVSPGREPRRIIWIGADTLRADHLGCYGYTRETSPNIDAFTRESTLFERCISTCPWTFPAFGAMMTGRYPSIAGAVTNVKYLPDDELTLAEILSDENFATLSVVNSPWVGTMTNLQQGFDACKLYQHLDANIAFDTALKWLEFHKDEDVLVFIHLMDPHLPYDPKKENLGRFGPAGYSGPFTNEFDLINHEIEDLRSGGRPIPDQDKLRIEALYDEEIFGMDQDFGVFLDRLKGMGCYDDSMIIFSADHGEEFWEHGGFEHGHQLYDELLHVPLIIKGGGFGAGEKFGGMCSNIDIYPTVLRWLDFEVPEGLNGVSLYDLTGGRIEPAKRHLLSEQLYYGIEQKGVSTDEYRYIFHTADGAEELYDLKDDAGMHSDVAPDRRKTARQYRYLLKEFTLNTMSGWHMRFSRISSTIGGKEYDVVITAPGGFTDVEWFGLEEGDTVVEDGDSLILHILIDTAGEKVVNFSTPDEDTEVMFDISIDGGTVHLDMIHLGPGKQVFPESSFALKITDERFGLGIPSFQQGGDPGLHIWANSLSLREELTPDIGDDILNELRSLGYLQ